MGTRFRAALRLMRPSRCTQSADKSGPQLTATVSVVVWVVLPEVPVTVTL